MSRTALAVKEKAVIARPLKVLVPLIKQQLSEAEGAGVPYYREAGKMLIEAEFEAKKEGVRWSDWLEKNFALSRRTAFTYMSLAREYYGDMEVVSMLEDSGVSPATPKKPVEYRTLSEFERPNRPSGPGSGGFP